jgi:hypothetical protein
VVTHLTEMNARLSNSAMSALIRGQCVTDRSGVFRFHFLFTPAHEVEDWCPYGVFEAVGRGYPVRITVQDTSQIASLNTTTLPDMAYQLRLAWPTDSRSSPRYRSPQVLGYEEASASVGPWMMSAEMQAMDETRTAG